MKDPYKYHKESYPFFWAYQVKKYGFDDYCKGLCDLIEINSPQTVYELGIGTGWPFAAYFHEKGICVSGSDISETLITSLKKNYPGINATVESYEDINPNIYIKYDIVYCLRCTWYFLDILKAIDKMFELVKPGGRVVFDIMNKDSDYILNMFNTHRRKLPITILKNTIKKLMFILGYKHYLIQDPWNMHEIPVSSMMIERYLNERKISFKKYSITDITNSRELKNFKIEASNSKIVFDCIA